MKFENIKVFNFENALRGMRNPKESYQNIDSYFDIVYFPDLQDQDSPLNQVVDSWTAFNPHVGREDQKNWLIHNGILSVGKKNQNLAEVAFIGPKDMKLAQSLIKGGPEHRKFMRQIFVTVDITAPLYWWKEFDTYKVGTVANSTSTMHTIQKKPISIDNFETGDYTPITSQHNEFVCDSLIPFLEDLRTKYNQTLAASTDSTLHSESRQALKDEAKKIWKELIHWLPEGWLQTRTVTFNYENLLGMCSPGQRRFHKLAEWSGSKDFSGISFIEFSRNLPYAQELIFIDELEKPKASLS